MENQNSPAMIRYFQRSKPVVNLLWSAKDRSKGDQQILQENSIFTQNITNPPPFTMAFTKLDLHRVLQGKVACTAPGQGHFFCPFCYTFSILSDKAFHASFCLRKSERKPQERAVVCSCMYSFPLFHWLS